MAHNRLMTVASVGILTACLFITGAAVLLGLNVNNFAAYLAGQNEIIVYLQDVVQRSRSPTKSRPRRRTLPRQRMPPRRRPGTRRPTVKPNRRSRPRS